MPYIGPKKPTLPKVVSVQNVPKLKILARAIAAYTIASNNNLEFIKSVYVDSDSSEISGSNTRKTREAGQVLKIEFKTMYRWTTNNNGSINNDDSTC